MGFKIIGSKLKKALLSCKKNHKIISIYDTPHLLKNIRNNLLKYDFIYNDTRVTFDNILIIYTRDKPSHTAHTLIKISKKHNNPSAFEKMSCKIALQLLSHTMATAIRTAAQKKNSYNHPQQSTFLNSLMI